MPLEDSWAFPHTPTPFQKVLSPSTLKPLSETSPPRHSLWSILGVYRAIDRVGKNVRNLRTGEGSGFSAGGWRPAGRGPGKAAPWGERRLHGRVAPVAGSWAEHRARTVRVFPSLKSERQTQLSPGSLGFTFLVSEWCCFTALGVTTECVCSSALRGAVR